MSTNTRLESLTEYNKLMGTEISPPVQSNPLTPPLKWAGGKRWLIDHLERIWFTSKWRRLVEPFCGGLAIALGLRPQEALLNDINPHLINFYTWLQRGLVISEGMYYDSDFYYEQRNDFNHLIRNNQIHSKRAAELFYYLNRTGYNGLCRFNQKGGYNVPFGRYKSIRYNTDFVAYRSVLKNWRFTSQDFESLSVDSEDFIYADPPYDVEFRQYSKQGFSWKDQERLAYWLASHPGPVVASNQKTDRIVSLYQSLGFEIQILMAPRMISRTGDRSKAQEVLAFKNLESRWDRCINMGRNTQTGKVLESMICPSLEMGGYELQTQVKIGLRPGGSGHFIDAIAIKGTEQLLISLKWQQVTGTAEQKVPFEVICLMDALKQNPGFTKAYLVLGGNGWKLKSWYTGGGLSEYLQYQPDKLKICLLEDFIAMANSGQL